MEKLLTHLTRGSDEMHFFYDAQKHPMMVNLMEHFILCAQCTRRHYWDD